MLKVSLKRTLMAQVPLNVESFFENVEKFFENIESFFENVESLSLTVKILVCPAFFSPGAL